jgi:integrase
MKVLTAKRIETLVKRGQPGRYLDGRVPGLAFQISKGGGHSWVLRYKRGGPQRERGLGPLSLVNLEDARENALKVWAAILEGRDPIDEAAEQAAERALAAAKSITFDEAADKYIDAHSPGWKNKKHAAQWRATLAAYASPLLGPLPIAKIDTALVMKVIEPIWSVIPETASRVRSRIENILDWAIARGYRTGPNPAAWRGHLAKLLPARSKIQKKKHHPALPFTDAPRFMADLASRGGLSARALEFLTLTATRTNEVTGAREAEFDLAGKLWTIPAERMKAERDHRVPLTDRAITILKTLPREAGNDYVFIGARAGRPISNASMAKVMKEMAWTSDTPGKIAVPHGMRSTFRTWCAECTSYPREIAEVALAHKIGDNDTEAAYQRGDLLAKRARLMAAWAKYCYAPATLAEVVPLRRAKA